MQGAIRTQEPKKLSFVAYGTAPSAFSEEEAWAALEEIPTPEGCDHPDVRACVRTKSNGVKQRVVQCLDCGRQMASLSRDDPEWDKAEALDFDHEITQRWKEAQERAWASYRQKREAAWQQVALARSAARDAYYLSVAWRQRADLRLTLDRRECQARLNGCSRVASDVHHLTYDHFGNEPLFDLQSVCRSCHDQITAMDDARTGKVR